MNIQPIDAREIEAEVRVDLEGDAVREARRLHPDRGLQRRVPIGEDVVAADSADVLRLGLDFSRDVLKPHSIHANLQR